MDAQPGWAPLTPEEVSDLFSAAGFRWWIAGGWAIDLFVGHQTREHGDIDVEILRRDQASARALLSGWDLWAASPPGELRPWGPGEPLPAAAHDVWCREAEGGPWRLQLMIGESRDGMWAFRRDTSLTRPFGEVVLSTDDGIPFLSPEIQLLYKAKDPAPKDDADFLIVLPLLDDDRREWLLTQLRRRYSCHRWLLRLCDPV